MLKVLSIFKNNELWVKNTVTKNEYSIILCPTSSRLIDFHTKTVLAPERIDEICTSQGEKVAKTFILDTVYKYLIRTHYCTYRDLLMYHQSEISQFAQITVGLVSGKHLPLKFHVISSGETLHVVFIGDGVLDYTQEVRITFSESKDNLVLDDIFNSKIIQEPLNDIWEKGTGCKISRCVDLVVLLLTDHYGASFTQIMHKYGKAIREFVRAN